MHKGLNDVVIVGYGRSAVAKSGKHGALRMMHPVDLGGQILRGVLDKIPALKDSDIDDVIVGCAQQELSQSFNIGRLVAQRAGLPDSVSGMSCNRFCSSGLQSVALAAASIHAGFADVIVAGGVESMSSIPINYDNMKKSINPWIWTNKPANYSAMGITAENVAKKYGITRLDMEEFTVSSHKKAAAAQTAGRLAPSILPLTGTDDEGKEIVFCQDQGIRKNTSLESLASLEPCFKKDGLVTAGTSSPTSDGAGFVILMSEEKAKELNISPIAKFTGFSVAGLDPAYMGLGPIYAVPKVMEETGLTTDDMDVIELNEAFAVQALMCIRKLGLPPDRVNPNGGALALGHPLGATGAILICKALDELQRIHGTYSLITMCIGGGMGAAGILQLI
ncbi:acetyl-CoA acetyltransferase [Clostridium sp. SY8519]|uniref:thiolase family protein n=1 Tax=Clostridium sp. (strain SY8519) TaxID=1042156 RepID=UPI0002171BC3|nr:thiolase family protein [Clostridium sp. SY8519]BAK47032.1 acetyl-CoA acetyltransferase [Clostridium sp. SY8519]